MAALVVESKLESLRRCLQRVRDRCPARVEQLEQDLDAQDILSLNLSRAVQLCVDIGMHLLAQGDSPTPSTMGETFERLAAQGKISAELAGRMKSTVGFRNLAVHSYDAINWGIVHSIATKHLGDFEGFARAVLGDG